MKKRNKLKGSAILVVLFSSVAFYIYAMSVFSESEHFSIMQDKYEKNIINSYEVDEVEFYQKTLENLEPLYNF